jgi:inosine/xanthosine triphosphatase
MKIAIGSTNQIKVDALKELVPQYEILAQAEVFSVDVPSRVSEQPKSIGETVEGARNRALGAFPEHDLSFGIESGLIEVPHTKTGMMDMCVCAIYDGTEYHIGLSSAFECPPKVMELVHSEGFDLNQAFHKAGLTDNPKIGSAEGAVGLLTKGRVTRMGYTKQAITMAMIHLENAEFYKKQ